MPTSEDHFGFQGLDSFTVIGLSPTRLHWIVYWLRNSWLGIYSFSVRLVLRDEVRDLEMGGNFCGFWDVEIKTLILFLAMRRLLAVWLSLAVRFHDVVAALVTGTLVDFRCHYFFSKNVSEVLTGTQLAISCLWSPTLCVCRLQVI